MKYIKEIQITKAEIQEIKIQVLQYHLKYRIYNNNFEFYDNVNNLLSEYFAINEEALSRLKSTKPTIKII